MNKLVVIIFFLGIFVGIIQGKSSKKGLCIPPGTNFHCGDLAAFDNVRFVLKRDYRHACDYLLKYL